MENRFYPQVKWDDNASLEEKVHALYNIINTISREMYVGRVPQDRLDLDRNIKQTKQDLEVPISISFVTMAESGNIDEVTAAEHTEMFLPWEVDTAYKIGDMRSFEVETVSPDGLTGMASALFKCLQGHVSQKGWEPDVASSLWKNLSFAENGVPEWSQPISASDAYNTGDEVMYNGVHYKSLIDNNVWAPDVYPQGWEIID